MSNTETVPGQHPNPGDGGDATAASAEGQTGTDQTATEGEGNGGKAAVTDEAKPGDGAADAESGAKPEAYQPFTVPEGYTLEGERLTKATEFFQSKGMDQGAAQEAINLFVEMDQQNRTSLEGSFKEATDAARAQQTEEWGKQSRERFGENYEGVVQKAFAAVQAVGSEKLMEVFNSEGWGNHPELIAAFAHFGGLLVETGVEHGRGAGQPKPRSAESILFDHPTSPKAR